MNQADDYPTLAECLQAMRLFTNYYLQGLSHRYWLTIIRECEYNGRFPPGKGFLHELDRAIARSDRPAMPDQTRLYRLICGFCI